jgi:hypothetical protein
MFGTAFFPVILGTIALCACAVAPPTGPAVVALPPVGKNLAQFQREDTTCRGYAQQQIGSAVGGVNASASAVELQQRYDVAYAQCMAASGNSLQTFPVAAFYGPYGYPYGYPGYFSPWYGPAVSLGFFGSFAPHFHHHFGSLHGGFHLG